MSSKELFLQYLASRLESLPIFPPAVTLAMSTVSGDAPFRLKLGIALSELVTFAAHLRKPIKLYDDTTVPVNAITFALSKSGTSKDKSLNAVRKSMDRAYLLLQDQRLKDAERLARQKAKAAGDTAEEWRKYYTPPKPLQAGLGTAEGLVRHFAEIATGKLGAGSITSSEIGTELQTNGNITEIIKIIAVAYDLGNVPAKIIKSSENQTPELSGFPVNALFFGSQEGLLFHNDIKSKFKLIFNTQLARRSLFIYTPEELPRIQVTSIEDLYAQKEQERTVVLEAQTKLNELTAELVKTTDQEPLVLTQEAQTLFDVYLELNAIRSSEISNKFPISKLSQKHKQWLALKLSGAYAILAGESEITEQTYALAVNTCEFLTEDLLSFEKELIKEPYELFSDMCHYKAEDGQFFMSLHDLRKMGYIQGSGASRPKLEDLAILCSSYDKNGNYEATAHGIEYTEIAITDVVGVSYKLFDTELTNDAFKEYAVTHCDDGYEFYETTFGELELLLMENAAYSPFHMKDGVRNKDSIIGGTKFIVLDIDDSFLTDEEAHTLLSSYNHYIVRTSDPENAYKYRILLELDATLDIDDYLWKQFIVTVGKELGFAVDQLPKSQVFLAFSDRTVHSQLQGQALPTKQLLEEAKRTLKDKPKSPKNETKEVKKTKLGNPRDTFNFAFEAVTGERSTKLYRALMYAIDLGADSEYIEKLANEINDYWINPLEESELYRTLITPIQRKL